MKCPRCGKTLDGLRCNVCKLNIDTDELAIIGNKMRALSETIAGYVADQRKQAEDRKRAGQEAEGQKEASDREAAQRADNAISAIGPVSFSNECERTIKHARGVYDALTDSQKAYVRKVKTLQNAEAKFESLRLDNIAAQKVIDMINTLGKDSYTEEFGRKISYTRLTYNNLSVPQRSLVSNYSKLTSAETDYDNLRKASEKREQSRKMIIRFCVAAAAVVVCIGGFALFKTGVFNGNQTRPLSEAFFGSAKQGDEFTLGKYEQDNNFENGAEDIEWVVVNNDVVNNENDMILAVSKYCLDNKAYNESESYASTDWEHCSLRQWLNDDFICENPVIVEEWTAQKLHDRFPYMDDLTIFMTLSDLRDFPSAAHRSINNCFAIMLKEVKRTPLKKFSMRLILATDVLMIVRLKIDLSHRGNTDAEYSKPVLIAEHYPVSCQNLRNLMLFSGT